MEKKFNCPLCGGKLDEKSSFCPECGVKIKDNGEKKGFFRGLKIVTKGIGDKASSVTSKIGRTDAIGNIISAEKASSAVRKLLNIITTVSQDVKKELPADMIKAVDLSAEISFIAFTIGVQIDLEQIPIKKKSWNIDL